MDIDYKVFASGMVDEQLITRSITSRPVLDAMRSVPRHLFVPERLRGDAYVDSPLPIGLGQTISQPYIVAYMTERLDPKPGMKILEIGTGSGYQAAVLAHIGCEVFSIELREELAAAASKVFTSLNIRGVHVKCGDGFYGWPEEAPFDAVIVTAAPEDVPERLTKQLAEGGRLIVPVGKANSVQWLKLFSKADGRLTETELIPVRFVPMVNAQAGRDQRRFIEEG